MQTHNLVQGSPEWLAHRRNFFNASDAPAMMGCSSYKTRTALIAELATGLTEDVDAATQKRFDDGHRFEALARAAIAEKIIGEELAPLVGSHGKYGASYDGINFMEDTGFEHKTLNARLRAAMTADCTGADLPLEYQVQMEHQCMVRPTLERMLFVGSKWERVHDYPESLPEGWRLVESRHCWYTPNMELRAKILAGWAQLEEDVAAYDPAAERPAPAVATPVESLPAVAVQLQGSLAVVSNLPAFGEALKTFIERIPVKPATDQEFADTEAACRALKKAEEMLEATEASALAQISDVEVLRRTVADLRGLARTTRLAKEKLVTAEKEARRSQIVTGAQASLDQHIQALNQRIGANWLPLVAGGFGEVIKGKKSLVNMEDAVAVALTDAKHIANLLARRLEANRAHLVQEDGDWIALFADFATVGAKDPEDFQALAALRIGNHKQAEAARLEAERERIRREEQERADREAREKLEAQANQAQAEITQAGQQGQIAAPLAADLSGLVAERHAEGVAALDANQAIGAAKASAAAADSGAQITLGQLNARLSPISITAAGLAELGFEPCATAKAAKLYRESDFVAICRAIAGHAMKVAQPVHA